MTVKSLNFYGYDGETFRDCGEMIRAMNVKHSVILNSWFLGMMLLYVIFAVTNFFGVAQERVRSFAAYLAVSAVFELLLLLRPAIARRWIHLSIHVCCAELLSFGIVSSVEQPYMPASMYLVLLILVSLSFMGGMLRTTLFSSAATAAFLLTSYEFKTFSIAYHDTYNVIVVLALSIGLHYLFQRTRLEQFILYQREQQIFRELEVKSSFDPLTSLLNRGRFFSVADEALRTADSGEYAALCLLDLDGFKEVNDTLGHQMGDKVIQVAGRVVFDSLGVDVGDRWSFPERALRERLSFAGRLGGDEFIAFVRGAAGRDEVRSLLERMLAELNSSRFDGLDGIRASVGVVEMSSCGRSMDEAYRLADLALYESKRAGKNRVVFHGEVGV